MNTIEEEESIQNFKKNFFRLFLGLAFIFQQDNFNLQLLPAGKIIARAVQGYLDPVAGGQSC